MRKSHPFAVAYICALLVTLTACGADDDPVSTTSATQTQETAQITTDTTTATTADTTAPEPPAATTTIAEPALMPDVVCMNLQAAQDRIQSAGVFFSRSEDATGEGRSQVLDRNWIVVAQTPAPGAPFTEGEAVLSVVKIGEQSPC